MEHWALQMPNNLLMSATNNTNHLHKTMIVPHPLNVPKRIFSLKSLNIYHNFEIWIFTAIDRIDQPLQKVSHVGY